MNPVAKTLMLLGASLVVIGLAWQFLGHRIPLGRLPGDLIIERENFRFYFPIGTCIVLSLLLTLAAVLFRLLSR